MRKERFKDAVRTRTGRNRQRRGGKSLENMTETTATYFHKEPNGFDESSLLAGFVGIVASYGGGRPFSEPVLAVLYSGRR